MVCIQENGSLLIRKINEILLFELVWNQSESIEYQTVTPPTYWVVNFHVFRLPSLGKFPPENVSVKKFYRRKFPLWETRRTGITRAIRRTVWATAVSRHHGYLIMGHTEIPRKPWYGTVGFERGLQFIPNYAERHKALGQPIWSIAVRAERDIVELSVSSPRTFFANRCVGCAWSLAFLGQFWWNLLVKTLWCLILFTRYDNLYARYELLNAITLAWKTSFHIRLYMWICSAECTTLAWAKCTTLK